MADRLPWQYVAVLVRCRHNFNLKYRRMIWWDPASLVFSPASGPNGYQVSPRYIAHMLPVALILSQYTLAVIDTFSMASRDTKLGGNACLLELMTALQLPFAAC